MRLASIAGILDNRLVSRWERSISSSRGNLVISVSLAGSVLLPKLGEEIGRGVLAKETALSRQLRSALAVQAVSMSGFGGDQEGKALQYIADGEKVLKKWTLFSSTTKNEDAAEFFDKAARCYKVGSPSLFFCFSLRVVERIAQGVVNHPILLLSCFLCLHSPVFD